MNGLQVDSGPGEKGSRGSGERSGDGLEGIRREFWLEGCAVAAEAISSAGERMVLNGGSVGTTQRRFEQALRRGDPDIHRHVESARARGGSWLVGVSRASRSAVIGSFASRPVGSVLAFWLLSEGLSRREAGREFALGCEGWLFVAPLQGSSFGRPWPRELVRAGLALDGGSAGSWSAGISEGLRDLAEDFSSPPGPFAALSARVEGVDATALLEASRLAELESVSGACAPERVARVPRKGL